MPGWEGFPSRSFSLGVWREIVRSNPGGGQGEVGGEEAPGGGQGERGGSEEGQGGFERVGDGGGERGGARGGREGHRGVHETAEREEEIHR